MNHFRSNLEKRVANRLEDLGVTYKYEPYWIKYNSPVTSAFCSCCSDTKVFQKKRYLPDFVIDDGTILEAKGYFKPESRRKMKDIVASGYKILMIFDKDNKIPRSKMKYSDWCKKYNVPYCVGVNDIELFLL